MAGRPPKPTSVLKMSGAFKVNPGRYADRGDEPEPDADVGNPPDSMPEHLVPMWAEIKGDAAPGVLTRQDRAWLESACKALFDLRALMRDEEWAMAIRGQIMRDFTTVFSRLGFNPSDRSKVAVKKKK